MYIVRARRGFTLIELLVVVAIIALLISILMPSLSGAREQGKRAQCLANMRSIGQASHTYAAEDARDLVVPIHAQAVTVTGKTGWNAEWWWRTALPFAFGGRTATVEFPTQGKPMWDDADGGTGQNRWVARTRPLNRYILGTVDYSDSKKMEWFHCPSDKGYPNNPFWIQDCPPAAADIPCYNLLGNSYRINVCGLVWYTGSLVNAQGFFSVSSWGHKSASMPDTGKLVLYSEPLFYNMSRRVDAWDPNTLPLYGWHKKKMSDNVSFVDGSARTTTCDMLTPWDVATLTQMDYTSLYPPNFSWAYFLRRGKTWRTDCYPTPGARVPMPDATVNTNPTDLGYKGWPFTGWGDL